MALQTRTIDTYGASASCTLQYDDSTVNLWLTAVILTVDQAGRQWFASVTDTQNGHTFSATRGAGTFPVPANQISLASVGGFGRLQTSLRYPA